MTKKTVVIACVTFETVMVTMPAVEYKADEVHIFHYVRPGNDKGIYHEFYDEVVRQLGEKIPMAKVIEHKDSPVYDFRLMLRDVIACIDDVFGRYEDVDIFINVSQGTSEFVAAGVIAAMMSDGRARAFTVHTDEFTVEGEDAIRNLYFKNGRPVGLSAAVHSPTSLPYFQIERPDENALRGLRVYSDLISTGRAPSAFVVINEMKRRGVWLYSAAENNDRTDIRQKETMYYQRHFIKAWEDYGWIKRGNHRGIFEITPIGRNILETFYLE